MKGASLKSGKSALELLEEATHLLRSAPAVTMATYYIGAIPFVVGLLYFWADMSRSPFANQHLAESALVMAGLFLWMKFCQALFAQRLRAQLASTPAPAWSFRGAARTFLIQTVIQPSGLFLIPLALILTLPFGWIYAFYQNVTADDGESRTSTVIKKAWAHTFLWPLQNHIAIGVAFVFGLFVFLNWLIVALSIPSLLKMFFGIESIFSRSASSMLNTTFLTAMFGLTYLSLDPILKTVYVLRCFYGESLRSGEDLKAHLKEFTITPRVAIVVILVVLAGGLAAAAQSTGSNASTIPADELDKQIDQVIHESKYAWRIPRNEAPEEDAQKGIATQFVEDAASLIRRSINRAVDWIGTWFRNQSGPSPTGAPGSSEYGWIRSSLLLYALLAVVLCILAVFLLRMRQQRRMPIASIQAQAIRPAPNVADENVGADQLPEDGWVALAHGLLERAEFRLAMRAFYLSSLAHLANRNLIDIARFKSNREYERELRRRAHALPELLPVFEDNISVFERIWYGMHDVNGEIVRDFASSVEKITAIKTVRSS